MSAAIEPRQDVLGGVGMDIPRRGAQLSATSTDPNASSMIWLSCSAKIGS
jgi:hypothetical protein